LRSQTICNTLFVDKSVQSVMSLIQARGGLPLRLLPVISVLIRSANRKHESHWVPQTASKVRVA